MSGKKRTSSIKKDTTSEYAKRYERGMDLLEENGA